MACRQLVKPSTLCLHLSPTLFVRILPSNTIFTLSISTPSVCNQSLAPSYTCASVGVRRCNFQLCGIEKTVAGGRKMCCSVCYYGLPLLSLLARMAALADACVQYGRCACCAFSLPNAVCRYSVDKLRVCLHS